MKAASALQREDGAERPFQTALRELTVLAAQYWSSDEISSLLTHFTAANESTNDRRVQK